MCSFDRWVPPKERVEFGLSPNVRCSVDEGSKGRDYFSLAVGSQGYGSGYAVAIGIERCNLWLFLRERVQELAEPAPDIVLALNDCTVGTRPCEKPKINSPIGS